MSPDSAEPAGTASTRLVFNRTAAIYVERIGTAISPEFETAIDRAALDAFANMVLAQGGGPVLDIGCGTGRATAYLAERGLDIAGVDLSSGMLDAARVAHENLSFELGSLTDLPADGDSLVAASCWYSILYTPLPSLGLAWAELARVLRPGGIVIVAFQAGENERIERKDVHGSAADLVIYRHSPDDVAASLEQSGFTVTTRILREPELQYEDSVQAILLARLG